MSQVYWWHGLSIINARLLIFILYSIDFPEIAESGVLLRFEVLFQKGSLPEM